MKHALNKKFWLVFAAGCWVAALGLYAQWPAGTLPPQAADKVVVIKSQRVLHLLRGNQVLKSYPVSLGRQPAGAKERQGDHRTPEGNYILDYRNPRSQFHLALHISYPNAADIAHARRLGVDPGGDIMVHGLPARLSWLGRLHRLFDWTDGCIAVTNAEIDQIWRAVPDGTPIEVRA